MNSKMIFAFAAGLMIGAVATWKIVDAKAEAKYKKISEEEIQSVKREFSKDVEKKPMSAISEAVNKVYDAFNSLTSKTNEYISLTNDLYYNAEEGGAEYMSDRPYVISPDDFGENDDYDIVTLTYYSDEILEDDNGDIVDDVDRMVGLESLSHFGEYEDDAVHVRNDVLKTDFEILRDIQTYSEANSVGSYSVDE